MKKIFIILTSVTLLLTGCGKTNKDTVIKDFTKSVEGTKSYTLKGTMEISNDEETFVYSLEANYLKDDYYKVILVNQTNNHEQIILKNEDGVYVITPSLNKSFKFDSIWPENSSQAYLLNPIINDITNDQNVSCEETDNNYIIKSTVNYPNNSELTYQKIYLSKDMDLEKVEVFNKDDILKIKVVFTDVNMKSNLNETDFKIDEYIEDDCGENCENEETSSLDSIIYPLYVPANTYLTGSESLNYDETDRVILTFAGDKNFVLVEESATVNKEFETIPIYGDPVMLDETVGALSSNSMYFVKDGIDYYLVSNDLTSEEMMSVAKSLGRNTLAAATK